MKVLLNACAALLAAAVAVSPQDGRDELRRLYEQSQAAHRAKDHTAFLAHSRRVAELAPRSTRALYNLACAHALTGGGAEAIRLLERLAAMGVAFDPAADEDFASLRTSPEFQAVVRSMAGLSEPVGKSEVAFQLPEKDMIEGVVHDAKTGAYFVSSVRRRKIVRVASDGAVRDFTAEAQDGLGSVMALGVDPARRALWVTTAATAWMRDARKEDEGRSWLVEYDADSGTLRRKLGPPAAATDGHLSDLVLDKDGGVTVADPDTGRLYALAPDAKELSVLLEPGRIASPQGMAWSADGRWLFVADYTQGVARVDPRDRSVTYLEAPPDVTVNGIDGLLLAGDSLVAIQNGIRPHRITRLRLDPEARRILDVAVVERANPRWDEPTLGTLVGKDLYYVGTSQYAKITDAGVDEAKLQQPLIFKTRLEW
jgi:sugar lactone lactonase YvrE